MLYSSRHDIEMLLGYQGSAFEHIFPALRLVSMQVEGSSITFDFYIDGPLSDDDDDSINQIGNYFDVDFPPGEVEDLQLRRHRCDYPAPIHNFPGECIFARWEEPPLVAYPRELILSTTLDRREKVLTAAQRALINHVFPELYSLSVTWTDTTAMLCTCVEGEISERAKA
jgi:hypothetical protein